MMAELPVSPGPLRSGCFLPHIVPHGVVSTEGTRLLQILENPCKVSIVQLVGQILPCWVDGSLISRDGGYSFFSNTVL